MREDTYTNTEADAAEFENNYGPTREYLDDTPTRSEAELDALTDGD